MLPLTPSDESTRDVVDSHKSWWCKGAAQPLTPTPDDSTPIAGFRLVPTNQGI